MDLINLSGNLHGQMFIGRYLLHISQICRYRFQNIGTLFTFICQAKRILLQQERDLYLCTGDRDPFSV